MQLKLIERLLELEEGSFIEMLNGSISENNIKLNDYYDYPMRYIKDLVKNYFNANKGSTQALYQIARLTQGHIFCDAVRTWDRLTVAKIFYEIEVSTGKIYSFEGRYRRDLETDSWHYYEKADGIIIHFRKEHIICVTGDTSETVIENKSKPITRA